LVHPLKVVTGRRKYDTILDVPGIVDPRPQVEKALRQVDAEFAPKLDEAAAALQQAPTRHDRRLAKRQLRHALRQRRRARNDIKAILRVPASWFKGSGS
jgi:hypothetical protein